MAKTKQNDRHTYVRFVLDETGSMASCVTDTLGGYNTYMATLVKTAQKNTNVSILASLTLFSSRGRNTLYDNVDVATAEGLVLTDSNYHPGGMTPLVDACVEAIEAMDATLKSLGKKARKHAQPVIAILTDGQENCSRNHTSASLAEMVRSREEAGWEFVFLGVDIDAFSTAKSMGFDVGTTLDAGRRHTRTSMEAFALNVSGYAASGNKSAMQFTPKQRKDTAKSS